MEKLIQSTISLFISLSLKISTKSYKSIISILFIISLLSIILTTTITVYHDPERIITTTTTTTSASKSVFTTSSPKQQDKLQQEIDQHQSDNSHEQQGKRIIIFPNNFPLIKNDQLVKYYIDTMNQALHPHDLIYRNCFEYKIPQLSYSSQKIDVFSDGGGGDQSGIKCRRLSSQVNVKVSPAINKNGNMRQILTRFMQDDGLYFQEFLPFFPNLKEQLRSADDDIINKHWYQFIGSTVWLQQYGAHLMISRIIYTEVDQGLPIISLAYLQLFDRNWNELNDVELIIPDYETTTTTTTTQSKYKYKSIIYPYFAPIPIYHNVKQLNTGKFFGVEDPRIMLITNEFGFEEPIIIYNSHHRKILNIDYENGGDNQGKINFKNYRSLFIGWLWKTQIGKFNLEQLPSEHTLDNYKANKNDGNDNDYSKNEYIKIKELTRPNNQRNLLEKNWSLFLNHQEKLNHGYHSFIYFIYQFKDLKILKCPLSSSTTKKNNDGDDRFDSGCQWEYQINDDDNFGSGYLHGGTELINVNELLDNYLSKSSTSTSINGKQLTNSIKDRLPLNRQIWIGFARAAMRHCGCSETMYRPNMVILVKDDVPTNTNIASGKSNYRLTHVSSFMDLGIEVLPWWEDKGLCEGKNVVIPNGISSWTIENESNNLESESSTITSNNLVDYLTITITRRDTTIDLVYIKGLLNALLLNPDNNNSNNDIDVTEEGSSIFKSSVLFNVDLVKDYLSTTTTTTTKNVNKNLDCALQYSHKYCQIYGEKLKIEDEFNNKGKDKSKDKSN